MIDRITDAGQCDYYEVIFKARIIRLLFETDALLIFLLIKDCRIQLIRDERENIFNCTRLRFEQHKHGEKKTTRSLRICISSFVHCYGKQKRPRIVEKNNSTAVSRMR